MTKVNTTKHYWNVVFNLGKTNIKHKSISKKKKKVSLNILLYFTQQSSHQSDRSHAFTVYNII